jgi:hypothetical protein
VQQCSHGSRIIDLQLQRFAAWCESQGPAGDRTEMGAEHLIELVDYLEVLGIDLWLDGSWGRGNREVEDPANQLRRRSVRIGDSTGETALPRLQRSDFM